jgi:hypothetical protein
MSPGLTWLRPAPGGAEKASRAQVAFRVHREEEGVEPSDLREQGSGDEIHPSGHPQRKVTSTGTRHALTILILWDLSLGSGCP